MKYISKPESELGLGNLSSFRVILSLVLEPLHFTAARVLWGVKLGFLYYRQKGVESNLSVYRAD